ncbi:M42 family metallopeptidase [Haploplasma axanthum]|uniref:Glutamyl aminopeptidase n=1 Tax=Haploplasma axanthum TaxID=29552 RepID=A0A449BE83_HAPAX|nr:M42 family metallopeptidase [Haploplasma axanthum]VEU80761.1 Glutamyl aminopeptidase [Haploplasma axanthum]
MNKIYKDLMNLPGVSGNEKLVRNYIRKYMEQYPNYSIKMDNLGSIFAVKKSNNPSAKTIMIAGHMDEVGFMVANITKNGHIKLQALGGWMPEVLLSQVMNVYLDNGEVIKGIIGSLPPHLKESNKANISDFLLDVGSSSKEETISYGVKPGQMILFDNNFSITKNNKRVISKAIDNRYGCGLALEVIKKYHDIDLDVNLVVGATVQEEVGLRGATTSTKKFKPDMFIALDASPVNDLNVSDVPGLGKGFLLRLFDPRNVMHQGLINYFVSLAKKYKIPYQDFISKGGTDAAAALDQIDGVLATTIGLPARYIHSTAAMMDINDLNAARKMVFKVIETTNSQEIEKIKEGYFDRV